MTDAVASQIETDDGRSFCFRHPDRETWIRCGRCDRPICTGCAMQGPVGMRCRDCGKPAFDALTSLRPAQVLLGSAIATGGGAVVAFIGVSIGFFGILIGYFGGRIIVDVIERAIGFKRGRVISAMVVGGILVGAAAGVGLGIWSVLGEFVGEDVGIADLLRPMAGQLLLTVGALLFGAVPRLR